MKAGHPLYANFFRLWVRLWALAVRDGLHAHIGQVLVCYLTTVPSLLLNDAAVHSSLLACKFTRSHSKKLMSIVRPDMLIS